MFNENISTVKNLYKDQFNYVEADILTSSSKGDVIYKGNVTKYYLAKDNQLDKLILEDVYKKKFNLKILCYAPNNTSVATSR